MILLLLLLLLLLLKYCYIIQRDVRVRVAKASTKAVVFDYISYENNGINT